MQRKLSREEVLQIPALLEEGLKRKEVAEKLSTSTRTIDYWIGRLREEGIKVHTIRGPRPLKLKD